MSGLGGPVQVEETGSTNSQLCSVCNRAVPESLLTEKRCFLHFMALIESELGRFVKLAKCQIITREVEGEVARFVVDSSLRLTVVATGGCGLDIREKRKFASLLMDLVTLRDDVDKAIRRSFLVN